MFNSSVSDRLHRTLFVTQSLFSASQIAMITLLSIVAVDLSGTDSLAGLPSTIGTFSQAGMAYFIGIFMGRFGRRLGLSISYGIAFIGSLLGVIAVTQASFPILLVSALVFGMGRAGAEQGRFAAGEIYPEHLRARKIGQIVFAGTIGAIVGPLLVTPGGQIAEAFGININAGAWLVGVVLYTLAVIITMVFLRPDPTQIAYEIDTGSDKEKVEHKSKPARPLRELLKLPSVQLGIIAMLVSQSVMVALMVITPVHMDHNNLGQGEVSIVISAHTLGMFGLSGLTGYLIDRYGRNTMLIVGALTLIASAIIAPLNATMPFLIVGLFLLGLGWNFGYIAGSSLLADALEGEERSQVQGFNDMLVAFSAGCGSLISGPLFEIGDYVLVSVVGILVTFILMVSIRRLTPRTQLQTA